jgi:hypothetical protein
MRIIGNACITAMIYNPNTMDRSIRSSVQNVAQPFKAVGLFQHVYSSECDQSLYEGKMGKLIRWLEVRHSISESE